MKKTAYFLCLFILLMTNSTSTTVSAAEPFAYNTIIDYKDMTARLEYFAERYPDLIQLESLGKTYDNRHIWLAKVGKGDVKLHINASVHARERITTNIVLKNIQEMLNTYGMDNHWIEGYDVTYLLDHVTFYIVPMVNPDGVDLAIYGKHGIHSDTLRNNLSNISLSDNSPIFPSGLGRWKANARGVDLNRQFPTGWHSALRYDPGTPSDSMYKGPRYLSETEAEVLHSLQMNNPFVVNSTYHTQGSMIYWYKSPDWAVYERNRDLAESISRLTGFSSHPLDDAGAGFSDWVIGSLNVPSVTMEFAKGRYSEANFPSIYRPGRALPLLLAEKAIQNHENAAYEVLIDGTPVKRYQWQNHAQNFINTYHAYTFADVELLNRTTGDHLYARYKPPETTTFAFALLDTPGPTDKSSQLPKTHEEDGHTLLPGVRYQQMDLVCLESLGDHTDIECTDSPDAVIFPAFDNATPTAIVLVEDREYIRLDDLKNLVASSDVTISKELSRLETKAVN